MELLFQLGQFDIGALAQQGKWGPDVWINIDLLTVFVQYHLVRIKHLRS